MKGILTFEQYELIFRHANQKVFAGFDRRVEEFQSHGLAGADWPQILADYLV